MSLSLSMIRLLSNLFYCLERYITNAIGAMNFIKYEATQDECGDRPS